MSFVQAFARTSRAALRQKSNASPVQLALGKQGSSQYLNGWRSYATAFERNKPHVNIGMSDDLTPSADLADDSKVQLVTSITAR